MHEHPSEHVIVASRWTTIVTVPMALLAIGLGLWALFQAPGFGLHFAGSVAIFFGVAALPILLVHLFRPTRLHLNAEAMIIDTGLSKPKVVRWDDVEGFVVWKVVSARLPAFRYSERHGPDGRFGRALRRSAGVDAALTAPWPLDPEVLVNVLNQYRTHYGH